MCSLQGSNNNIITKVYEGKYFGIKNTTSNSNCRAFKDNISSL